MLILPHALDPNLFRKIIQKLMVTLETINEKLESFNRKFDRIDERFNAMDEKIDDLAAMTTRGFRELEERLEVIEENYVTKADLVNFTRSLSTK